MSDEQHAAEAQRIARGVLTIVNRKTGEQVGTVDIVEPEHALFTRDSVGEWIVTEGLLSGLGHRELQLMGRMILDEFRWGSLRLLSETGEVVVGEIDASHVEITFQPPNTHRFNIAGYLRK